MMNVWLEDHLLPKLKKGSVIVIHASPTAPQDAVDNATFHKSIETRDIIKQHGCFALFLPPYSPHLNPIEKLWANIKRAWKYEQNNNLQNIFTSSNYIWN